MTRESDAADGEHWDVWQAFLSWWRVTSRERRRATFARHSQCAMLSATSGVCVAIKDDGTLFSWGSSQLDLRDLNNARAPFAAVSTGCPTLQRLADGEVPSVVALGLDGRVACAGNNEYGQAPPEGLEGNDFVAVSTGGSHTLALRVDGSCACYGLNDHAQAPPNGVVGPFRAIAAGGRHSLGLTMDGSRVLCWGWNRHGQAPNPDAIQGPFVAISAGIRHSLAIRVDGSVACWGDNSNQQAPSRDVRGPFVGVAAGDRHSCAIRVDGSVACWGDNSRGQAPRVRIFPAPGGAAAVCCAAGVSLAVRPDGGVTPWGDPTYCPPEDVLVLRLNRPTVPASSGSAVASSSYAAPAVSYLVL